MEANSYEIERLQRVEENRRVLIELGLVQSGRSHLIQKPVKNPTVVKKKSRSKSSSNINGIISDANISRRSVCTRRTSKLSLLSGEDEGTEVDLSDTDSRSSSVNFSQKKQPRPNVFGHITDIPVGTTWMTRMECSHDGVHRPTVAGIHGGQEGAYSLALSGGYEDDVDYGDCFTYTGSGGRDLKGTAAKPKNLRTAPQSKDQKLEGTNAFLAANVESRLPVRVIRGYKLPSMYAPEEGYRYDGLYTVEKYWFATGKSGFKVIKYALKRVDDQDPSPWSQERLANDSQLQSCEDDESVFNHSELDQPNGNSTEHEQISDNFKSCAFKSPNSTKLPLVKKNEMAYNSFLRSGCPKCEHEESFEKFPHVQPNLVLLPGQTTILKYFKRTEAINAKHESKNNVHVDKTTSKDNITVENVRSLRGNKRMTSQMNNCVTSFESGTSSVRNSANEIIETEKYISNKVEDEPCVTNCTSVEVNGLRNTKAVTNNNLEPGQLVTSSSTSPVDVNRQLIPDGEESIILNKRKNKHPMKVVREGKTESSNDQQLTETSVKVNRVSKSLSTPKKETPISIESKSITPEKANVEGDQNAFKGTKRLSSSPEVKHCYVKLIKLSDNFHSNEFHGWDYTNEPNFAGFSTPDKNNAQVKHNQLKLVIDLIK